MDPLPEPWAVGPDNDSEEMLASGRGIALPPGSPTKILKFPAVLVSSILSRQRDPAGRVAPLVVLSYLADAPKVLAMVSALTSGRVHEHGPGHGEALPGTLAEVWRTPPANPSAFWLDIRGDKRTPRPVPVILCDPHCW